MKIRVKKDAFDNAIRTAFNEEIVPEHSDMRYQTHFRARDLSIIIQFFKKYGIYPYSKSYDRYIQLRKADWYFTDEQKFTMFMLRYSG